MKIKFKIKLDGGEEIDADYEQDDNLIHFEFRSFIISGTGYRSFYKMISDELSLDDAKIWAKELAEKYKLEMIETLRKLNKQKKRLCQKKIIKK